MSEDRNLHLGRAGIGFMNAEIFDDLRFLFYCKRHGLLYLLLCQGKQGNRSVRIIVQRRRIFKPLLFCQRRGCWREDVSRQRSHFPGSYLMVTFAPTSAIFSAIFWASSFETPSLIGLGALSTTSLASFRPRPVSSRTTLMTLIFSAPTSVRMASNSVCSSSWTAGAASAATATGAAAAATGAALTPHLSCRVLESSTSSRTFNFSISSMMDWTDMDRSSCSNYYWAPPLCNWSARA